MTVKEPKIFESILYDIWKKQQFKSTLKTSNDDDISVLDVGTHSGDDAGPDFKNARIRIGNLTYVGDIEIDNDYSDWKSHGHNINNKYSKVILHAALFNRGGYGYVYTRDGRKVPSICLSEFIDKKFLDTVTTEFNNEREELTSSLKCHDVIESLSLEVKERFIQKLGIDRFDKKCKKIFARLKELQFLKELNVKEPVISYELSHEFHEKKFNHSDFNTKEIWQQLFYEMIFEALGYSKNKNQMVSLAQAANLKFLSKIEKDGILTEKYESALLFVSGIASNKNNSSELSSREYFERISLHWQSIRSFYDGIYLDETIWHFFRLRPQNFPTVRIAGGARIIKELLHNNLIGVITKKIIEIHNLTVLINSLRSVFVIKSDGFWKDHYIFDQKAGSEIKYFVGASRSDEIIINVVLPFFSVYFEVFGNPAASKKILKLFSIYEQKAENHIINDVAESLKFYDHVNKTVYSQGMIELFRNFCSKNKCLECEIGKVLFN
jgi:hypothetical protein